MEDFHFENFHIETYRISMNWNVEVLGCEGSGNFLERNERTEREGQCLYSLKYQ